MQRHNSKPLKYLTFVAVAVAVAGASQAAKFPASTLKGTFVFQLHGATSFAPFYDGSAGKPNSGIATAQVQNIMRIGVFTCDGKSNVTGRAISTLDDGISSFVIDYNWTGKYTVSTNHDGTGILTINPPSSSDINSCKAGDGTALGGCEAFEGAETYAFVISGDKKGRAIGLMQINNAGGAKIFLTGGGRTQNTSKGGGGSSFPFPF